MNSFKQTFWKKCMAIFLSVAVIFSGINPVMLAHADTAADTDGPITVTVNVAPSTVNATFYDGEGADKPLSADQVIDKGIVDNYHQYELTVKRGSYSYRGVDTLGTEDTADDQTLGGMTFQVPLNEEIMEDGSASGEGQLLVLRRINFYTTSTKVNIAKVGDYNVELYPAGLPKTVNGQQYIGTIGTNATPRVITPVLIMARGNALTYQGKISLSEEFSETYGVANIVNYTLGAGTSVTNKTFAPTELIQHTITAPAAAKVQVFNQINNFNVEAIPQHSETDNGDGTITHLYKVIGNNKTYRVSMDGKITRAGYFGTKAEAVTVTYEEQENPKVTGHVLENANIQRRMEASTMVNVNGQNNLRLETGDVFRLRAFRGAWQIIDTDTANIMIEPDFHYNVISGGEHIEMTPATNKCTGNAGTGNTTNWMDIKAVSPGTAVLEVSYDAIMIGGNGTSYDGLYGATDPQRKSLIVIQVGEKDISLQMKAKGAQDLWDTEYDTLYFTGETGTLDFTATLGEDVPERVELSTDHGSTWKDVQPVDGVYQATGLTGGNNILRFTKGTKVEYQVVRAAKVSYTVANVTRSSEEIIEGDQVKIEFKGLYTPVSKISGIYNPGFGQGHKVEYTLPEGVTAVGAGGQYDFISTNTYTVTTANAGMLNLTGGHVSFNVMGESTITGGHRTLTDEGCGSNFSAVSTMHARGVLPDIAIDVVKMPTIPVTLSSDVEGTEIVVTDENEQKLTGENNVYVLPYGQYSYVASKDGYVTERGNFEVDKADKERGEKSIAIKMRKVEGAIWDGTTVTEPAQVEGVYQIGTGAELAWFAKNAGGTSYHAILTDDISLGGFLWTPIANSSGWKGTFDGNGHYVTDLYVDSTANNVALFGYVSTGAVIKNLGVKGNVTTTGKYAAGIATAKATTIEFTIENCKSDVNVTADSYVGGIIANQSAKVAVKNCYNIGNIKVTKASGTGLTAGGVSCPSGQSMKVVIENCYNTGIITGVGKHGSVAYLSNASYAVNVKNSYGLAGTCNIKGNAGTEVTKDELKNLAPTLGDAYIANPTSYNEGYPILAWEAPKVLEFAKEEFSTELEAYKNAEDYRVAEQKQLEAILKDAENAIEAAKTFEDVETAVAAAKTAMDQLKTDADYIAEEKEAAKKTEEKLAELEAGLKEAQNEAAAMRQQIAELQSEMDKAAEEHAAAKDVLEQQIKTLKAELKDADAADKKELQDQIDKLQAEMNQEIADHKEKQAEQAGQIEQLQKALSDAKAATEKLQAELDAANGEVSALKQMIADMQAAFEKEIAALKELISKTESTNAADKKALEQMIADLKVTLQTTEVKSEADKKALEADIAAVQAALNTATGLQKEDKAALEKQIAALQLKLEELSKTPEPVVLKSPSNVKASNDAKTGRVKVTWNAVEGADEYIVYRAAAKSGPYKKMITTTGTKYTNISGTAGKTYYYKVKAVSDDKNVVNSSFSKVVKRTYDLARPAVTVKSKTKKQVKLTWKKTEGAKKYVVYRATSKNGKYTKIATTTKTTFTNKKLKSGKTYYYKVKAVAKNSAANSAFSLVDKCKVR